MLNSIYGEAEKLTRLAELSERLGQLTHAVRPYFVLSDLPAVELAPKRKMVFSKVKRFFAAVTGLDRRATMQKLATRRTLSPADILDLRARWCRPPSLPSLEELQDATWAARHRAAEPEDDLIRAVSEVIGAAIEDRSLYCWTPLPVDPEEDAWKSFEDRYAPEVEHQSLLEGINRLSAALGTGCLAALASATPRKPCLLDCLSPEQEKVNTRLWGVYCIMNEYLKGVNLSQNKGFGSPRRGVPATVAVG